MKNMATELGIILIGYFTLVPAIQVSVAHGFGFAGQSLVGTAGPQQDLEFLSIWCPAPPALSLRDTCTCFIAMAVTPGRGA